MCNCIENLEEKLTKKMLEEYPNGEIEKEVEFQNKTYFFGEVETILILSNPTLGKMKIGKSIKKFSRQIMPLYCPYCGEKLKTN